MNELEENTLNFCENMFSSNLLHFNGHVYDKKLKNLNDFSFKMKEMNDDRKLAEFNAYSKIFNDVNPEEIRVEKNQFNSPPRNN